MDTVLHTSSERYNTGFKRLSAAIVDWIIFLPLIFVDNWVRTSTGDKFIVFLWLTVLVFARLTYSVLLHQRFGQTMGKWVAGIKVLDISETRNLTLIQSLLRDIFYIIVEITALIYFASVVIKTNDIIYPLIDFDNFGDTATLTWVGLELITVLMNDKRRAIHDFIAKSVVVRI